MSINIGPPMVDELKPKIAVIGVGGAGGNAVANMISAKVEGVDFVVANAENAAGGSGLTPPIFEKILRAGVDVCTLGDHTFRKRGFPTTSSFKNG